MPLSFPNIGNAAQTICGADHLVCAGPPGPALSVEEPKAFDNCDRPTRASAAVQGDRPGDRPTINAGIRLREKYAALRFSVQRRTSVRRAVSRRYCTRAATAASHASQTAAMRLVGAS